MKPYIYIRTLKHAEHTVFCVQEGQKAYFDPLFNRMVPYSSGQQIKRCILTTIFLFLFYCADCKRIGFYSGRRPDDRCRSYGTPYYPRSGHHGFG